MKTITATPSLVLPLGRMGENEYTRIQFDVSGWLNELPSATIGLYNQRPNDADAYPVDGITVEDGIVTWTITSAELAQVGKGRCELVAVENNIVAKSAIYNTIVFDALDGSGDAPSPWDSWQQTFVALKAEAVQAAQDAETAAEHYPRIVNGIWQVWDAQTEGWVSTGVHATGADGQDGADGVSPTVSVTDISGGHRVTITDAEGQHTFDVLDGEDGTDGTDGQDGFSPTASVTQTATGATISITDKTGTTTANIENGTDGTDGEDGYSPTVTVTDITGGHRVTVTDADGAHTFDVMDGTGSVQDVQVNGTSVVTDGVANVPIAGASTFGVVSPDAKTSAMTQSVGIDANGKLWTAAGGGGGYPQKVFELEYTGNWHKCNVTAIDYATGVITLADNDAPFTDDYSTAPMVWCVPLLDGVKGTYQWGYMPPELYAIYKSSSQRGVLVGTNQIKLYTSATASINTITETSNVDLTRFQIWVSSYLRNYPETVITDLNPNHRYRIACSAPHGGECSLIAKFNGNVKSGVAYGYGYRNYTNGVSTQNAETVYNIYTNGYETISFRGIKHFSTDEKMFESFPKHMVVDLFRLSGGSWQITGTAGYVVWGNKTISNISATDKLITANALVGAWLNDSIYSIQPAFNSTAGGSFAPLDGGRFTIFDMGEEY